MKRAFTLIELLVVIAIIAILAAILFPVFAQAKSAAKKTASLSNFKQYGTGTMLYEPDNDDLYPRGEYKLAGQPDWATFTWRDAIMPYVKNGDEGVTWLPLNNGQVRRWALGGIFQEPTAPKGRWSVSGHRALMPGWNDWQYGEQYLLPSRGQSNVDQVSQTLLFIPVGINPDWEAGLTMETAWWWHGGAQWPPVFTGPTSGAKWDNDRACRWDGDVNISCAMPRYRHNGTANIAYADGHAKGQRKGALNWCRQIYTPGFTERPAGTPDGNYDWIVGPGQPCEQYLR